MSKPGADRVTTKKASKSSNIVPFRGSQHFLSNFYTKPGLEIRYDNRSFSTAEALFQYRKAKLFGDTVIAERIAQAAKPGVAKRLGRQVKGFRVEEWLHARMQAMEETVLAKFAADEELRQMLLGTGDKVLVEAAPRDKTWGVGLSKTDPRILHPDQWPTGARNLLGKALMKAREQLRSVGLAVVDEKAAAVGGNPATPGGTQGVGACDNVHGAPSGTANGAAPVILGKRKLSTQEG